jgi:predicted site-specific integrase-resolvase
MSIKVKGQLYDGMKEACDRLGISRQTMLRYLAVRYFTAPKIHKQGKQKLVRYFDDAWYDLNETKFRQEQESNHPSAEPDA